VNFWITAGHKLRPPLAPLSTITVVVQHVNMSQ
jgi:hypothetical protein